MFLIRNVILACWVIFSTLYIVKSSGKQDHCDLTVTEIFLIRNVILACWVIFSALYIVKSSGKQDHCDLRHSDERWLELIIAMLICRHYRLHLHFDIVKIFWGI